MRLILALLLLAAPASANPLQKMDQQLEQLRQTRFSTDVRLLQGELGEAQEHLSAMLELSRANPSSRAFIRLAEGYGQSARALIEVPCPGALNEAQCALYRASLAERAQPLLDAGAQLAGNAEEGAKAPRERRRVDQVQGLLQTLRKTSAQLVAAHSPSPKPTVEPPSPTGPPAPLAVPKAPGPDARFVRIWADAIWRDGRVGPQSFQALDWSDSARAEHFAEGYVALLIEDHDGLLEVEVGHDLWNTGAHCRAEGVGPYAYVLRFFVDRQDAMPVLGAPFERGFDDGTAVRLNPGVPVLASSVLAGGMVLQVPVPEASISDSYVAVPRGEMNNGLGFIPKESPITLGGRPVALYPDDSGVLHSPWFHSADGPLLSNRSACGEVTVSSPAEPRLPRGDGNLLGALMGSMSRLVAQAGTAIYWPDGRRAGVLRMAQGWAPEELSAGPLRCVNERFGGELARGSGGGQAMRLCFDERDLSEEGAQPNPFEDLLKTP